MLIYLFTSKANVILFGPICHAVNSPHC